jgi:hypothetical protein
VSAKLPLSAQTAAGSTFIGSSFESNTTGNGGIAAVLGNFSPTLMTIKNNSAEIYWVNGYIVNGSVTYEVP